MIPSGSVVVKWLEEYIHWFWSGELEIKIKYHNFDAFVLSRFFSVKSIHTCSSIVVTEEVGRCWPTFAFFRRPLFCLSEGPKKMC